MGLLKNAWYVAAWDNEIEAGHVLSRTLLGERILLLRDESGVASALQDRCPHRFVPLHVGTYDGKTLRCRYHGLAFNSTGICVHNPQGDIPKNARVRNYPLIERHSLLWIWLGDPALADDQTIPDFSFQDSQRACVGKDYLHVKSNYLLEVDNILDLSHIQFLHATTLGSGGVAAGRYESSQDGHTVWSKRLTDAEIMTDELSEAMGVPPGQPADRWINVRWDAPANLAIFAGAVPHGRPHAEGRETPTGHLFTPETESTTHYWFSICFDKRMGEFAATLASEQIKFLRAPFELEDLPILELQHAAMANQDFRAMKPIWLAGDAAAARARRVLAQMLEREGVS